MRFRTWSLRSVLLPVLGVILIAGSILAVLALGRYQSRQVMVVVAAHDIEPLAPIMPGDVEVRAVPVTAVPKSGAYHSLTPLVGQFVQFGVVAGDVIRPEMLLATPVGSSSLDVQLRQASSAAGSDLEAVPLPLDQSAGFTLPHPGDRVSILGVLNPVGAGGQATGQVSKVVIGHALVLSIIAPGSAQATKATPFAGSANTPTGAQASSGVLVLALAPTDAERLVLAEAAGKVTLVLDPLPAGQGSTCASASAGPAGPAPATGGCTAPVVPPVTYSDLAGPGGAAGAMVAPAPANAGTLPPVGKGGA